MKINGQSMRTIWPDADGASIRVIDQIALPHRFLTRRLSSSSEAADAIVTMVVRGAPLIGATAAYGYAMAMREDPSDANLEHAYQRLYATRPTAVNLRWALDALKAVLQPLPPSERFAAAWKTSGEICDQDVEICRKIGEAGLPLIRKAQKAGKKTINILTHCNAGWLACVDWGTALAPIYIAHDAGLPVHVYVDETRPRNQGASLTAYELGAHGVPHTVIPDNTGGHLMQHGMVDLCIVGTDRTTARGDVCNKIGTYLKALAAHANHVPFYVALPHTTIDWTIEDGLKDIPIEERSPREVTHMTGRLEDGTLATIDIMAPGSQAVNYAFDVTPAHLVTALVTDRGVAPASREGLESLFPERGREMTQI
jgi:methylthioribose-1-phosphate isomerase